MENREKNTFLSVLFFVFIVGLIVAGYLYTNNLMHKDKKPVKKEEKEIDYRIDKDKDYIYFENENIISEEPDIVLKDAFINIEGAEIINSSLKTEMDEIRKQVVYLNESNTDPTKEKIFEESNIYSALERQYVTYKTKDYFSLLIKDLSFNCYEDFTFNSVKSYVIDLKNSKVLTNEEILSKYNIKLDDIKNKISERLDSTQSEVEGQEVIKKDETLNNIDGKYGLYFDGISLYVSYVVKSNFVDYNDSIIIN